MKQFIIFVKKEFRHIFRDRKSLLIIIMMPIVQIILFGFALTNEIKNSNIAVLDNAKDEASRAIIQRLDASRYFNVTRYLHASQDIEAAFKSGTVRLVVVFQPDFRESLMHSGKAQVQLIADASDPNTATTVTNYAGNIISDYQKEMSPQVQPPYSIRPEIRMLYNPQLKGAYNFVPGVMAMILILISAMMTSVAIVREKEINTMEVLLVSPLKPLLFILSKAIPYVFLSLVNVSTILLVSVTLLEVPINGSLLLLMGESFLFILTSVSLGLMISNLTKTQQEAQMFSLMTLMLPTLLLGGFMFPIESMPLPLQIISNIVPSKWFFLIVKDVMIKGLGFSAVWKESLVLVGMTLFLLAVSFKKFKTRLA
ncbi:MAG TPA: ABC transporter permease [Ferruginibacter sp.]|nr:multidrug ABC transporter permease [Chitinophagaceae bacterium]HRI24301.1 ABC transporter permease [Ferruginibacter sp.]